MRHRLVVAALAWSALAIGCEAGRNDPAIANRVMDRLRSEPALANSNLQARTEDGNVVLSGTVATPTERMQAEDIAADVPGVDGVINQIEIAGGGAMPPPVGAPPPADRPD